ncbi:MAG: hypothetical protein KC486_26370 [Myxococcales bacterium]|nr:hypothetical protein [Myxococcales bacterium]
MLAFALTACSGGATSSATDTAGDSGTTGDSDATGDSDTTGESDASTAGGPAFELAACALPFDCSPLCEHIGVADCDTLNGEGPRCAAKLLVAGTPGVLEHYLQYYGQPEVQTIYVMRGDGTAVLQTRTRDAQDLPWENPGTPMVCDVALSPELAQACEVDDFACQWQRTLYEGCAETTIAGCDEVEAWLADDGP